MKSTKNKTRYLILGLLSEQPHTGYDIKRIVDVRFSYFWSESFGQIYPELKSLESDGFIKRLHSSEINTPCRRVHKLYQITPDGLTELKKWLHEPVEKEVVRFELLLKLYFSHLLSPNKMIQHLQEFQLNHRKEFDLFEQYEKQLQASLELHENHRQVLMVLQFGKKVWKAYDEWCRETTNLLEELANKP